MQGQDPQATAPPKALPERPYPEDPEAAVLAQRRAFLGLTEADAERLRSLAGVFDSFLDEFVERFYGHLFAHPETASFLADPALVERLKRTQRRYFETLVQARYDAGYVEDRRRIGRAHAEVGLEPQWFIGAYNQYLQHALRRLAGACGGAEARFIEGALCLLKAVLLDLGLALDAYFAQSTDQLRKALQLLDQSNAELKEFAQLASHDLKTPLATVAGYCEEFLDEFGSDVPAEGRALVEAARARALQLGRTIGELLAMSEASAQPHQRVRVSTRRLLDEVLDRLRPELEGRPIEVVLPERVPDVFAHPGRFREVLYHLLSNAVKYHDKDPGTVRLWAESRPGEVVFCVEDDGPGIAEAELSRVFAPFRRLPQHRHLPGTGLGLSYVKMIVSEQGGRVWAESRVGAGSRFFVAMPAREGPSNGERPPDP